MHSGVPVKVTVNPREEAGIVFRYCEEKVQAIPENITDTTRCTRLGLISTVEHLMSAFAALGIAAVEIEVSAPELPALDGASKIYIEGLANAGIVDFDKVEITGPFARVFLTHEGGEIAIAKGTGRWRYVFEGGDRWPPYQDFEVHADAATYASEIAPARTFGFSDEIEKIRAAGLAKGLDEKTALVLGESGYVNPSLFPDEPARHKLLDLMGDLYLSGVPISVLDVVGHRTGHTANVLAANKLAGAVTINSVS